MPREEVRITLRPSGRYLEQIREVRQLTGLNTDTEAARYLITRGFEAMSAQLGALRLYRKMESDFTPEQLMMFAEKLEAQQ